MKALVTGGAGFIGSHLVEALLAEGFRTHVVDNWITGSASNIPPQAVVHAHDVRGELCAEAIVRERPDVVFHLAAQADVKRSIEDPAFDTEVNVAGTVNVLEACRKARVRKFVFASTSGVYGNLQSELITEDDPVAPESFYGLSKLTAEQYINLFYRLYGLSYTILRFGNVYGPRQTAKGEGGVVAVFLERLRKGLPLHIHGDGEQTRDFVFVKDVARAILASVSAGHEETIHVGTSNRTSVNEIVACLRRLRGSDVRTVHAPARFGDIKHSCLDNGKALRLLGWQPHYSIEQGLYETSR